jgi:hypothetical protein
MIWTVSEVGSFCSLQQIALTWLYPPSETLWTQLLEIILTHVGSIAMSLQSVTKRRLCGVQPVFSLRRARVAPRALHSFATEWNPGHMARSHQNKQLCRRTAAIFIVIICHHCAQNNSKLHWFICSALRLNLKLELRIDCQRSPIFVYAAFTRETPNGLSVQ